MITFRVFSSSTHKAIDINLRCALGASNNAVFRSVRPLNSHRYAFIRFPSRCDGSFCRQHMAKIMCWLMANKTSETKSDKFVLRNVEKFCGLVASVVGIQFQVCNISSQFHPVSLFQSLSVSLNDPDAISMHFPIESQQSETKHSYSIESLAISRR